MRFRREAPEARHLELLAPLAGHSSRRDHPGLVEVVAGLAKNGVAHAFIKRICLIVLG